ncbi:acyltransferase family protein [Microbacterium neungamense]|uniref:acyltransferase family protein n=1 Tax=Microbacterium neungamense TaxID=2810535 RepID=UPI00217D78F2|nr:acyltransferase [Microbacterium neungamense]UWF78176.1 acyltransferase [Microbacterium neungamense]
MRPPTVLQGAPYPYRANSLNLFRLILAGTVLVAHSFYTTGNGEGPHIRGENLGGWAVAGFFVISGFLITRSRLRTSAGEYLLHRIVRIFPAFLVCLVVTAAVFGPVAMLMQYGSLAGYATTPVTPLQFVWSNITLYMNEYSIGRTLSDLPYRSVWNGSLWTLYYEFLCYVMVWLLGALAWFRRSAVLAVLAFVAATAAHALESVINVAGLDGDFLLFLKLAPFFLGGACVHFVIERWGVNPWIGAGAFVVTGALILGVPGWGGQASAPFMAYGLLWLATVVPQPRWIAVNDVSYGFYIYAWPVQQLLALGGLGIGGGALGLIVYNVAAVLLTFVFAWLSWRLIEHPAMSRIRRRVVVPSRTGSAAA